MAAYTSTQSGNWSEAATWGGGGVPGDGDTATIANTHTVTIDQDVTVGTAPAGDTAVVIVNLTGNLTLGSGRTLNLKGRLGTGNGTFTAEAGSTINVIVGAGLTYSLYFGVYSSGTPTTAVYFNGTSGNHCTVTKTGDGIAKIEHYVSTASGPFLATYTDFSNLGSTGSNYAIRCRRDIQLQHCTFTNCGDVTNVASTVDADKNLDISYCTFRGSLGTYCFSVRCTTAPDSGKVRRLLHNSFDISLNISELRNGTVSENYFAVQPDMSSATYRPTTWSYNFVTTAVGIPTQTSTILKDFRYNPSTDNGHLAPVSILMDQTYDGCIFESGNDWVTNESDGVILASEPAAPRTYTIQNCITLPSPGGKCSCALFTAASNTNAVWRVKNNTIFAGDRGRGYIGVHWAGQAGMLEYFKNNIGWAEAGDLTSTLLESDPLISIVNNYVTQCDYNGYWHMSTAYDVAVNAFANPVGTHDLAENNPQFVDKDRDLAKWAQAKLGKTGTEAQLRTAAVSALANMNDPSSPSYHADASVTNLVDYIIEGFAPTKKAYDTASDTGSYIGAVPWTAAAGAITLLLSPM